MAGRNPEPINSIVSKGKSHLTKEQIAARKEAEAKMKFGTDKIDRPKWLVGKDATTTWDLLVEELSRIEVMSNVDIFQLAIACDAYANYIKASRRIRTMGQTVKHTNKNGSTNEIPNPLIKIARDYFQTFKSICSEFGLTPAARARITLPQPEDEEDAFAKEFGD